MGRTVFIVCIHKLGILRHKRNETTTFVECAKQRRRRQPDENGYDSTFCSIEMITICAFYLVVNEIHIGNCKVHDANQGQQFEKNYREEAAHADDHSFVFVAVLLQMPT